MSAAAALFPELDVFLGFCVVDAKVWLLPVTLAELLVVLTVLLPAEVSCVLDNPMFLCPLLVYCFADWWAMLAT